MKAKIIRGTTLKGRCVNVGDVVELDSGDFQLLRMQGDAVAHEGDGKPKTEVIQPKGK